MTDLPDSIDATQNLLAGQAYLADRALATVLFLALKLGRPIFLEGEPGTGKTEIAKALAAALGRRLIRLQCYEGLDAASAVYEWNFAAQMLAIRSAEAAGEKTDLHNRLFGPDYLIERPPSRSHCARNLAVRRSCSSTKSTTRMAPFNCRFLPRSIV